MSHEVIRLSTKWQNFKFSTDYEEIADLPYDMTHICSFCYKVYNSAANFAGVGGVGPT